jgi:hypothetical protein
VPFVRFSRDKRGYEHTYLMHESGGRGRPLRHCVLYWFRTPPGIKVGRQPFDEEARQKIEARNPGISFDWKAIASTPMPPVPEVEHWRERRKAERAAKVARREDEQELQSPEPPMDPNGQAALLPVSVSQPEAGEPAPPTGDTVNTPVEGAETQGHKRRRRRGGRRRRAGADESAAEQTMPQEPADSPVDTSED